MDKSEKTPISQGKEKPPHSCGEHRVSDGGGIDPRYPGKIWVVNYHCGVCGAHLGRETERLD